MTKAKPVSVAVHDAGGEAERELAQFIGGTVTASMGDGRLISIMVFVVRTAIGALLRLWWVPSGLAIVGICLLAVAITVGVPLVRRGGGTEPEWEQAARRHRGVLGSRGLSPANLKIIRRYVAGLPQPAFAYVSPCGSPGSVHFGTCQMAGLLMRDRRRLLLIGEHLATGSPAVLAAALAHESGHAVRWQVALSIMADAAGAFGWLIIGWGLPWQALLPAAAGLLALLTARSWLSEITCDLRSARQEEAAALLEYLTRMSGILAAARADRPRWQRYRNRILDWLTIPHPPFWLRCAVIRHLSGATRS